MSEEAESPRVSNRPAVEEEEQARPKFRPQNDVLPEEKEIVVREPGYTGELRKPSIVPDDPRAVATVEHVFDQMLIDRDDGQPFTGKAMTVVLGKGSKYIFDADKLPKILKNGAMINSDSTPDEIVVGRAGDPSIDPKEAKKVAAHKRTENAANLVVVAAQASATLKAMEGGSNDPTPVTEQLAKRFPGNEGLLIAERMDALSKEDLTAFAEMRPEAVSIAGSMMMYKGKESSNGHEALETAMSIGLIPEAAEKAPEDVSQAPAAPEAAAGAGPANPADQAGPKTMMEQASMLPPEGFVTVQAKGPAANDEVPMALLAAQAKASGRE
jgi:hypothetical protein